MSKIARTPPRPPAYDPNDSRYWDARDLEQELRRTFQICHECRMCVTYCGSFPRLFAAVDREVDSGRAEGAETLDAAVMSVVSDHCWQCKLCYIKCPYTPDEGAREELDFPRLMAREKAQRARREGIPLADRILGEPRMIGAAGAGITAPIANFVNASRLARKVTEKVLGIAADFPLPPLAPQVFSRWFAGHEPQPEAGSAGDVVLFATCYGEYNFPELPRAAVQVLEKNGFNVIVPEGLDCCGMPNLDGGDVTAARAKMQRNVDALVGYARRSVPILTPGPTCGYTMKKEWSVYLESREAAEVGAATQDLMQFLDQLRRDKKLDRSFDRGFGHVAYHAACHLRAQKIAFPGARLLNLLPDTEVRIVERCSAVDGTWGMKAAYHEEGVRYAKRMARDLSPEDEPPDTIITDCNLAGLRILQQNARRALHPVQALAQAYGLDDVGISTRHAPASEDYEDYEDEEDEEDER